MLNTYPASPWPLSMEQLHKGDNEEIQAEVTELHEEVTELDNKVNGDAVTYPYDDVITIENAVPSNLAGCIVKIEPVQSGSGDPSPTNIRPITGHTEISVEVTDGDETTNTYTIALGSTIYGGTVDFNSGVLSSYGDIVNEDDFTWGGSTPSTGGLHFVNCSVSAVSNVGISNMLPKEDNAWDKTYPCVNIYATRIRIYGNFTSLAEFQEQYSGLQVYYQKATPTTIQLTPTQIQLLKGQNTLTASTGQISVIVNGVSGSIGSVQEQVNGLAEDVAEIKPLDYSTTEQKTGQKWIDGKDIYFRTFTDLTLTTTSTWVDTNIDSSGMDTIIGGLAIDDAKQSIVCSYGFGQNSKVILRAYIATNVIKTITMFYTKATT